MQVASRMGNTKSSALSKELLEELKSNTKYTEAELCTWYQSFLKECPGGKISKEQFEGIYASFFPNADPTEYARHVFRSFDTNADGTLDFKEYIVALHLTSGGKTRQKLEWAFGLYDVDGNGTISKNEIHEIVKVLELFPRPFFLINAQKNICLKSVRGRKVNNVLYVFCTAPQ